jgi:hypothetical protein
MSSDMHHPHHANHPGEHSLHGQPVHDDVSFEARDVEPSTIYIYLIGLAVAVLLSYAVCVFVLRTTTSVAVKSDTPPPPIRQEMGNAFSDMPPEPRLQGVPGHGNDPQEDLREKIQADTEENEKADWVDQSAGIAQIPVTDAMRIIAEKGLPGAPAAAKQ